jgi:hypothetical protein
MLWVGVGLVAIAVNNVAAFIAVAAGLAFSLWFCATLLAHGVAGLRRSPDAIRRIGDPAAWRGGDPTP